MGFVRGSFRTIEMAEAAALGGAAGVGAALFAWYLCAVAGFEVHGLFAPRGGFIDRGLSSAARLQVPQIFFLLIMAVFTAMIPGGALGILLNLRFRARPVYKVLLLLQRFLMLLGVLALALFAERLGHG